MSTATDTPTNEAPKTGAPKGPSFKERLITRVNKLKTDAGATKAKVQAKIEARFKKPAPEPKPAPESNLLFNHSFGACSVNYRATGLTNAGFERFDWLDVVQLDVGYIARLEVVKPAPHLETTAERAKMKLNPNAYTRRAMIFGTPHGAVVVAENYKHNLRVQLPAGFPAALAKKMGLLSKRIPIESLVRLMTAPQEVLLSKLVAKDEPEIAQPDTIDTQDLPTLVPEAAVDPTSAAKAV